MGSCGCYRAESIILRCRFAGNHAHVPSAGPTTRVPRLVTFASAVRLWSLMLAVAVLITATSVLLGGTDSSLAASWRALASSTDSPMHAIVWDLRLPRA